MPDTSGVTDDAPQSSGLSRRWLLRAGALTGATIVLTPIRFAAAAASETKTHTITGHLATGVADFVYLPVQVPRGVRQLDVSYSYDKPAVPSGVLDPTRLGELAGFLTFDELRQVDAALRLVLPLAPAGVLTASRLPAARAPTETSGPSFLPILIRVPS